MASTLTALALTTLAFGASGCDDDDPTAATAPARTEASTADPGADPGAHASGKGAGDDWAAATPWRPGAVEPAHGSTFEVIAPWDHGQAYVLRTTWSRTDGAVSWRDTDDPAGAGVPVVRMRGLRGLTEAGSEGQLVLQMSDGCSGASVSAQVRRLDEQTLGVLESSRKGGWSADCAGPWSKLDLERAVDVLAWVTTLRAPSDDGDTWLASDSVGNPLLEFEATA